MNATTKSDKGDVRQYVRYFPERVDPMGRSAGTIRLCDDCRNRYQGALSEVSVGGGGRCDLCGYDDGREPY